jgi:CubicO group peptidase (beta-lactamase class C family)
MKRMRIRAVLACAVIAAPAAAQTPDVRAVEQYLARAERLGFNGAVLLAAGDRVLLERGYGWADREARVPAEAGTAFGIGSVVKQFTAAAILRLQEQGRLRVTDSIGRFLPGVPADKRAITLHHLLTHTSGLPREVEELPRPGMTLPTADEYLRAILAAPMRARPGAPHHYSNIGFRLLGMVVERASEVPYEGYLREQLWAPLGMERTGFALPAFAPGVLAHGYVLADEGTALDRPLPPGAAGTAAHLGHGGLVSTVGDLFRWTRALDTGRILADSSRRLLVTPHVPEDSTGASHYGYGWVVLTTPRNTRLVTHNGDDGVFHADVRRYVDEGVTLVFLTNQNDALAQAVLRALPRLAFGTAAADTLPATVAVPGDALARYAGEYRLPTGERLRLAHGTGRLEVVSTAPGAARHLLPLPPLEGDTAAAMAGEVAVAGMVDALLRGDVEAAVRMVAPESSAEEEREFWGARLPLWERRHGAYQGLDALGTVNEESGAWYTWILLRFARGANVVRVRHTGGTAYVQTAPPPLLSAAFALAPAGDGEFIVYSAQLRRTLRIQAERDARGEPRALLIHTSRGAVRAPRVP